MSRGAVYIAYGEKARTRAGLSMRSLRKHSPGIKVAVVSDTPFPGADIDIQREDVDAGARTWKTGVYFLSPFDHTLFLDADTEVRASPEPGFSLLRYVDMVLAQDVNRVFAYNKWPHLNQSEVRETTILLGTGHHMYFNSGVMFFQKNERVERMMAHWAEEWTRYGRQDQMALLRAIHVHPVRIAAMRQPWNTHRTHEVSFVYHQHHAARREGAPK